MDQGDSIMNSFFPESFQKNTEGIWMFDVNIADKDINYVRVKINYVSHTLETMYPVLSKPGTPYLRNHALLPEI